MTIKTKLFALAALSLALVPSAYAAQGNYTSAGCGLGTMLFTGKQGKVHLILAATTNGTSGNQTFGISSDTLGCTSDGVVRSDRRVEAYAEANMPQLSRDVAQGGGETLSGMAALLGKRDEASRVAFYRAAQKRYEAIFVPGVDARTVAAALAAL